jgi:Ca-activated chloride channel family protein
MLKEKEVVMKRFTVLMLMALAVMICRAGQAGEVGDNGEEDLSPYFFVDGDPKVDHFPLLKTEVKVDIAGITAEVKLVQVYKNDGKRTIEAIYVFPLGTKSAIHAMRMKIGDRIIDATIEELQKAQKIYENAKDAGQVASLLEQKRPNVFQMKVANIMPGDVVEVEVFYTEILVPEDGTYEFVYPTVVGPRFTGESSEEDLKGKDEWTVSPYLHEGEDPTYDFHIKVNLNAGMKIAKVWVPTHDVDITKKGSERAEVALSPKEKNGGNRDFILRYNLQGNAIHTGLLLYPGKDENFFLLMLEPPEKVDIKKVPPREYVFIVDVSGSMNGFPLEVSKTVIRTIVENLRNEDYFNVLFFSGGSAVLSEYPLQATKKNKQLAIEMIMKQTGGGGTQILDAFNRAMALEKKKGMSRIIVTATDGYVSVEKKVFDLIRERGNEANFFAFGIGSGVNRYIIDGIARVGRGEPFVATDQEEAEEVAEKFIEYIKHPLLTDIEVSFKGFDAYDVEPLSMPDLFAQRPLILFGKYKNASGKIVVTGRTVSGKFEKSINVYSSMEDKANDALRYLWAREKIARLSDYGKVGEDVREAVTSLGLMYNLMTEYTAFVAVDKLIRETGEVVTVKQPLPLPQGVSDLAVGYGSGMTKTGRLVAPSATMAMCEDKEAGEPYSTGKLPAQLFISGGAVPAGTTLDAVEMAVMSKIKAELEKLFGEWELTAITVILNVQNGKVTGLTVEKHDAKKIDRAKLEKIFKDLTLPGSPTGTITLHINYR